jgi:transposase
MGSEVISVVERRRRWPREKKIEVLMEALAPGASVTAVADRHGVARNLVYTWLRLAREGRLDGVVPARRSADAIEPAFVAIEVVPAATTGGAPVGIGQPKAQARMATEAEMASASAPAIPTASSASPRRRPSAIEIRLGNGRVVKVDEGIDPAALGAIIDALDGDGR